MRPPAGARDHHVGADREAPRIAQGEDRRLEGSQRLDEAEAAHEIVGQRVALHDPARARGEPDLARLGDEVADGEHEAVRADDHALPLALGAQRLRRVGVLRHKGPQGHHRPERRLQIVPDPARVRLELGRDPPLLR